MLLTSRSAAFRLSRWKQRRKQKKNVYAPKEKQRKEVEALCYGYGLFLAS
jgi:hypothetical protein